MLKHQLTGYSSKKFLLLIWLTDEQLLPLFHQLAQLLSNLPSWNIEPLGIRSCCQTWPCCWQLESVCWLKITYRFFYHGWYGSQMSREELVFRECSPVLIWMTLDFSTPRLETVRQILSFISQFLVLWSCINVWC